LHERLDALSSGVAQAPTLGPRQHRRAEVLSAVEQTLEAQLFEARVKLKLETAPVSMHLLPEWRTSTFKQIDSLYALENWDDDCSLPNVPSYKTFLRFVIHEDVAPVPAIGIGHGGNLLATYFSNQAGVSFEFFESDRCRLILHRTSQDGDEAVARDGPTRGTIAFLTGIGVTLREWR
jgi:hypothetical protein